MDLLNHQGTIQKESILPWIPLITNKPDGFEVFTAVTMKSAVFWDVGPNSVKSQKTAFFKADGD
jgi:hypothetical protein